MPKSCRIVLKRLGFVVGCMALWVGCAKVSLPVAQSIQDLAQNGDNKAQYQLGFALSQRAMTTTQLPADSWWQRKPSSRDQLEAMRWYRRAAKLGFAPAQNALGEMYFNGQAVKRDKDIAAQWFSLAAQQNHPQALYHLGKYHYELSVKKAYVKVYADNQRRLAKQYLEKAVLLNNAPAVALLNQLQSEMTVSD